MFALLEDRRDLRDEHEAYRDISKHVPNAHTIPSIKWYGEEGNYCALVMDMLGPTLQDLFSSHSGPFSLKTVLMIADQLISHVEFLHGQLYIHRGIKPDNFCIGLQDQRKIFMIDLGFAKRYRDPKTKRHMPYEKYERCANPSWCSLRVSEGTMASRRDDLESLGYMFVFFLKGSLPWHGTCSIEMEDIKSEPLEDLCKDLPDEFLKYLQYCRALKFDSDPDYRYLRLLFHQLFLEKGYENDWEFDWCKKPNNEGAAEEKDDKEPLEANDKKNGNNAEKRNNISKDLEESNNVTNADTDQSEITSVNNTDLKQVSEAKEDQKAQTEIKVPSKSVNFDDHHANIDEPEGGNDLQEGENRLRRSARLKKMAREEP